jgi:hypothetical protein
MNTSALKAFAPAVRKQLMEAVSIKLDFALSATTPDYLATYASQVRALRELATADRKGLVERVAYTWFNRLAALRYLDARNWHPFHARVLMGAGAADTLPELFTMVRTGAVPEELRRYVDVARMESILQGRIPSADPQGEAYRMLVLGACRFYHGLLPDVFERLDDETELLLPDDLLTQQSVANGFRTEITDEDCEQVEVLGWLYQFYISEKKDEVMKRKAAVPAEDIPAVTQLFTPHWIVRYLVENSLGRLWLLNRPESLLKAWMPYYIESAEPETEFLRIARPQDIRLCDPAAGSGHILTYAFDLLYVIYEEEGYAPSEIPAMILRHNLTGIEIDARAAQLSALALTLKAREKSSRFFQQQHFVRPNIVELRNIQFVEGELVGYIEALGLGGLFTPPILQLMQQFVHAKNLGSLIQPCVVESDIAFTRGSVEARDLGSNLFLNETHKKVLRVLEQAEPLTQRYHALVANPPYMGSNQMNLALKAFAGLRFPASKNDLFAMFLERSFQLLQARGFCGMITMHAWMFLSGFGDLRVKLAIARKLINMAHLGSRAFDSIGGEVVQTTAFIYESVVDEDHKGIYVRLTDGRSEAAKEASLLAIICHLDSERVFSVSGRQLAQVPGAPLAYWATSDIRSAFVRLPKSRDFSPGRFGMSVANPTIIHCWWEVSLGRIRFGANSSQEFNGNTPFAPYDKGGPARRWAGNQIHVINWAFDGEQTRRNGRAAVRNAQFFCQPHFSWTLISPNEFSARRFEAGFLLDTASNAVYDSPRIDPYVHMASLNSAVARRALEILNPTINFSCGVIDLVPVPEFAGQDAAAISSIGKECVSIATADWDSFETSWNFTCHPCVHTALKKVNISDSWQTWRDYTFSEVERMRALEAESNRLIIRAYGLQDGVDSEVSESSITLARADQRRDMASFLSYAIGCMLGRYSIDLSGLVLANGADGMRQYLAKIGCEESALIFAPDLDGIIPVLEDDWFPDDIVARTREFLKVTFGEATLRENIRFIEESLGRDLRSYFLTDFYKDHLQTYKKRPIYWMVQSPRKGFSVLIYLHRYTRDTMNIILNRYLREFQVKLRSKIDHLQQVGTSASAGNREKTAAAKELTKLTKTLHECEEWERQTILPLAQARIELDLDDGVKVNYLKLGEALAPIPGLAAAED